MSPSFSGLLFHRARILPGRLNGIAMCPNLEHMREEVEIENI